MGNVSLVLNLHHPNNISYENNSFSINEEKNAKMLIDFSKKSYEPALAVLNNLAEQTDFKFGLSMSGLFIEQCNKYAPHLLNSLSETADTGNMEILREPYHHSYAALYSKKGEFREEIKLHQRIVKDLISSKANSKTLKNPMLAYSPSIPEKMKTLGIKGVIAEEVKGISPFSVYNTSDNIKVLFRAKQLSNDLAFNLKNTCPEKYAYWLSTCPGDSCIINCDMSTFGYYNGIESFYFLKKFVQASQKYDSVKFSKPSALTRMKSKQMDIPDNKPTAWDEIPTFDKMEQVKRTIRSARLGTIETLWKNFQTHENLMHKNVNEFLQYAENKQTESLMKKSVLFLDSPERDYDLNQAMKTSIAFLTKKSRSRKK